MKQKKTSAEGKNLVSAFHKTNDPIAINNAIVWEARNFSSPLREPEKPRSIALSSEFARPDLLKHFPGFYQLRKQCQQNNVRIEYEYGLFQDSDSNTQHLSLIIHTDPAHPFNGFRKSKSATAGIPKFKLG